MKSDMGGPFEEDSLAISDSLLNLNLMILRNGKKIKKNKRWECQWDQ